MSLMNEGGGIPAVIPMEPANSGSSGNSGGWGGDGAWWIIILFLFVFCGWGNGNGWGGGFGGGNGVGAQGALTRADLCNEFSFNNLDRAVTGIQQGICDSTFALNNAITGGFNTLGMSTMQGFNSVNQGLCNLGYNVQQGFNATQVAMMQGQNALQAQLAQCCCDNRAGQADIKYQMATDTCAIQNTIQNTTRDGIDVQNRNHQELMNKLCQMEYNGLNDKYQAAMSENQALKFQLSQGNQNAAIGAMISASESTILRRTGAECPMPAYVVQPPQPVTFPTNCCGQVNYAGNGCGNCGL